MPAWQVTGNVAASTRIGTGQGHDRKATKLRHEFDTNARPPTYFTAPVTLPSLVLCNYNGEKVKCQGCHRSRDNRVNCKFAIKL